MNTPHSKEISDLFEQERETLCAIGYYDSNGLFQIVSAIESTEDIQDFFYTRMSTLALLDKKVQIKCYDVAFDS